MVYRHLYVVITLQVGHFVRWARGARRASSGEKVSLRFLHRDGVRHPSRQVVAPSVIPADAGMTTAAYDDWRSVLPLFHGVEELGVVLGRFQPLQQEFHGANRFHGVQQFPEYPHFLQFIFFRQ